MPRTKVIAKKDLLPVFKKGDELTIVPTYYEKDTVVVNEIYGVYKGETLVKLFEKADLNRNMTGLEIKLLGEKVIAKKGSCSGSCIELKDGTRYPSSLVRRYENYFEKV